MFMNMRYRKIYALLLMVMLTVGHTMAQVRINGSVFGGGNEAVVRKSTTVNIGGGSVEQSVYGGGNKADVLGNTSVTMLDGYVFNGIFGGGFSGSVGTFTRSTKEEDVSVYGHEPHEGCIGKPVSCADNTGTCTIVVTGGQIGPIEVATLGMKRPDAEGGPVPEGWVWGGGCGLIEDPANNPDTHFKTYVNETDVTIGGTAFILESIIGGGEFGRVLGNTHVKIQDHCQIGVGYKQVQDGKPVRYTDGAGGTDNQFIDPTVTPVTDDNALVPCSHWDYASPYLTYDPYYEKTEFASTRIGPASTSSPSDGKTWIGCVFGGGSGSYPYKTDDGTGYGWVRSAGWVEGNTLVEITGGHILTNVYGANEYTDVKGSSTVKMSGGTIGVPRTLTQIEDNPNTGNLFGGGKGDQRTYFNTFTNVGSTSVEVTGGIIYGSVYGGGEDGHVLGNAVTTIKKETGDGKVAPVIGCVGTSGDDGNVFGGGKGSVTALTAGVVSGSVDLTIQDGSILGSVYGGGQIASVGTYLVAPDNANYGKMQEDDASGTHGHITVNLTGGTIEQNVYGGCMGATADASRDVTEAFAAKLGVSKTVAVNLNQGVADNERGCAVVHDIFGCNNVNGSPQQAVSVHVHGTQHKDKTQLANTAKLGDTPAVTDAKRKGYYDVRAVYGGGNLAAYKPVGPNPTTTDDDGQHTTYATSVIIDGCGQTSIQTVYGGGNAASTPATNLTVNGTYEIEEAFGGGNGKDDLPDGSPNPGANVGYYAYSTDYDPPHSSKEERTANFAYGSGKAAVNIFGGTVHRVFGGSNTKGNVRQTAVTMLEEAGGCTFCVDEAYGGGKSAPMDAEAKLLMACIPGLSAAYGGAEAADIQSNVILNITNGTFNRVFGGNNISGTIRGSITVNIEEVGCKPIVIGELYGGGNQAGYSVYGYKQMQEGENLVWRPRESATDNTTATGGLVDVLTTPYKNPEVNVKSFTSIGAIYGGGYGESAVMVGNPTVNINVVDGDKKHYTSDEDNSTYTSGDEEVSYFDKNGFKELTLTIDGHTVTVPAHQKNAIGAINQVFGGGNAAKVIGNTNVNIGTEAEVYVVKTVGDGDAVTGLYTRSGEGTTSSPYAYADATGTADPDVTYYEKKTVKGVDIRGNVYGGGNAAEVTGATNVTIGKKNE